MRDRRFLLTAAASIMLLLFCVLASIACGSKSVGFPTVIRSLFHLGEETFENNVVQARIPRTVFGILAGASLSVSGALMQAVTRNPIADPSILGVNTGASLFVVCGIAFFILVRAVSIFGWHLPEQLRQQYSYMAWHQLVEMVQHQLNWHLPVRQQERHSNLLSIQSCFQTIR